jgi:outer membrane protein
MSLSNVLADELAVEDGYIPTDKILEKPKVRKSQSGFFYGAMAAYKTEIYKEIDHNITAFPVIGYRSETFSFLGPLVSYQLHSVEDYKIISILRYNFSGYEASDSKFFVGMDDRNAGIDIGLGLNYKRQEWSVKLGGLHDVSGRSNGFELKTELGRTFYFGPIFVEPNLSLSYLDQQYVDYYYGVEAFEATMNRAQYTGEYAINKRFGINISTPIFFGGFTSLAIVHEWYDDSITQSPLTDKNTSISARLIFSRFF